jgi:hypothetical protein
MITTLSVIIKNGINTDSGNIDEDRERERERTKIADPTRKPWVNPGIHEG